ncbi:MAG: type II toxin-antitoxin system RelE/ParE family toxin [Alloprevotella sp.]
MSIKFKFVMLAEAKKFILSLPKSAMNKILYNIQRVAEGEQNVELFKKLESSNIWEFRTLYNRSHYRLFAFWDTRNNTLVIVTHGIVKKTQKTPSKEIEKAERIRQEYLNIKNN